MRVEEEKRRLKGRIIASTRHNRFGGTFVLKNIQVTHTYHAFSVLLTNVADPDPGSSAFLNPGSGMGKKSGSGSGMNCTRIIFPRAYCRNHFFGLKYFNSLMRIRDGKKLDPGSGKTYRIRNTVAN
jgi:hypothetical protein